MLNQYIRRKARRLITTFYDPLVTVKIGGEKIQLRLSHNLKEIIRLYPDFNFNLPRIISYCEAKYPDLSAIDIGANVGDTVAYIRNYSKAPILCIDGEPKYLELLRQNTAQYDDIEICQCLVGNENKEENLQLKVERGTAFLEKSNTSTHFRTLENVLKEFPKFRQSKILKTDTDGFDTWILRSSEAFLKTVKPILFFEFDPYYITKNNDDPFAFMDFLKDAGYRYLLFYTSVGDLLLGCDMDQKEIVSQLVHYFSGRNIELYTDICAFTAEDQDLFEVCKQKEIAHFQKARNYPA